MLEAERPKWRERRKTGKPGVTLDNVPGLRSGQEVVINGAAIGGDGGDAAIGFTEIEDGAPGVIEEQAVVEAAGLAKVKGDGFVDGVGRLLEGKGVAVPVDEGLVAAIERPGFIAEAEDVLVVAQGFEDVEGAALGCTGSTKLRGVAGGVC